MTLNGKQQRFVVEYLKDLNATQAAIRAGYSEKTARQQGSALLSHPAILPLVAVKAEKQFAKAELTAERVLEEMRRLAFSDIRGICDSEGNLKPLSELTDEQASCIAATEIIQRNLTSGDGVMDKVHKVKLWDKTKNLELLAKYFNLLQEQVNVNVTLTLPTRLAAGRQRLLTAGR